MIKLFSIEAAIVLIALMDTFGLIPFNVFTADIEMDLR